LFGKGIAISSEAWIKVGIRCKTASVSGLSRCEWLSISLEDDTERLRMLLQHHGGDIAYIE
jgi:hypothetical protein